MASVRESITIPASADDVWQTVRDFGSIDDYVPPIASATLSGSGVGAERTLTLADGAQVIERLDELNDDARTLRYSIVESPLPVENYASTLSVTSNGDAACAVTWASEFDVVDAPDDEIASTFAELYAAGLAGLKEHHAGRGT
jgi:mxaD protein